MQKPQSLNDKIVKEVKRRIKKGQKKYGNDLSTTDPRDWLTESAEEMLDGVVYLTAQHFRMLQSRDYYFTKMDRVLQIMKKISKDDSSKYKVDAERWLQTFENYK